MENVTVSLYVEPSDLQHLWVILSALDRLELDNDYVFQPKDVKYSLTKMAGATIVNVPINLYMNFTHSCWRLVKFSEFKKEFFEGLESEGLSAAEAESRDSNETFLKNAFGQNMSAKDVIKDIKNRLNAHADISVTGE
jgi:hypothetical protein